jgi:hypothetical protein
MRLILPIYGIGITLNANPPNATQLAARIWKTSLTTAFWLAKSSTSPSTYMISIPANMGMYLRLKRYPAFPPELINPIIDTRIAVMTIEVKIPIPPSLGTRPVWIFLLSCLSYHLCL